MSVSSIYRWHEGALLPLDYCDMTDVAIVAADSWLVVDGAVRAIGLHRERFFATASAVVERVELDAFWEAAIALIPREESWFPRVELQRRVTGSPLLVFRLRSAPRLDRSVVVATHVGPDPRTEPTVKGPDLERMLRARSAVQPLGAGEGVLLADDAYVAEGTTTCLLWWRGDILCGPPAEFDRIDSVTVRSVLALARALGIDTFEEAVTPSELDGVELWALNALHGIRIVTHWVDGPELSELPGRLGMWRARLEALRKPL
ncbi:MAG: hypothetical protein JWR53_1545 [Glaciihabitans sp.]|nr:hypothetical protein [Glaciihabitans sp.]